MPNFWIKLSFSRHPNEDFLGKSTRIRYTRRIQKKLFLNKTILCEDILFIIQMFWNFSGIRNEEKATFSFKKVVKAPYILARSMHSKKCAKIPYFLFMKWELSQKLENFAAHFLISNKLGIWTGKMCWKRSKFTLSNKRLSITWYGGERR